MAIAFPRGEAFGETEKGAEPKQGAALFRDHVQPLLKKHCYSCHSHAAKKSKGGLVVDSPAALLAGGNSGPAIVPGKPEKSLFIGAVTYEDLEMPPKKKLPEADIARLKKWVAMGAPVPPNERTSFNQADGPAIAADALWSLQPVARAEPPPVKDAAWPLGALDHFILHRLETKGIAPSEIADKQTLLRRVYFDLIGLPPSPEAIEKFISDDSPRVWERVVDELLQSRHFGERWGRHWMDVVRYADSVGGGGNMVFDNAWRYRDWIIRSLNEDKPYDRFVIEQIAGDLLPADTPQQKSQQIIATGFLAIGRKELPEYDKDKLRMDVVDEQLDTLGKSLLGLSLGCARCHDHKFDPISARDYYALAGIFESTETLQPPKGGPLSTWLLVNLPDKSGQAVAVRETKKPVDSRICVRGDVHSRGEIVARGFLSAVPIQSNEPAKNQSGRLQLAQWIASPENPLTARVMANRIWHWLMGQGLAATPDNFGARGATPSHPELLDWLAGQLIDDGWSIKQSVRRIVLSRTYQLGSGHNETAAQRDPANRLYWRHTRRRLEAESIRDAMLAVSGKLDRTQFGKTLTFTGRLDEDKEKKLDSNPWNRRSVYLPRYREDKQVDIMEVFDAAHPAMVTGSRENTTVPTQALFLLNSPFVMQQAEAMADQLLAVESVDDLQRIALAYERVLGRGPSSAELQSERAFLQEIKAAAVGSALQPLKPDAARRQAWASLCHTLLASNEFLFVE